MPNLKARTFIGKHLKLVLVVLNEEFFHLLRGISQGEGAQTKLILSDPEIQTPRAIVMDFPLPLPPSLLFHHS